MPEIDPTSKSGGSGGEKGPDELRKGSATLPREKAENVRGKKGSATIVVRELEAPRKDCGLERGEKSKKILAQVAGTKQLWPRRWVERSEKVEDTHDRWDI